MYKYSYQINSNLNKKELRQMSNNQFFISKDIKIGISQNTHKKLKQYQKENNLSTYEKING